MSALLNVKFPFDKLRSRKTKVTVNEKSQSSLYRQHVRLTNRDHYNQMQKKDRERKQQHGVYKAMGQLTETEAIEQRAKWKVAKRKQRPKTPKVGTPQKKVKMMTVEERRHYNRKKQQESRNNRSSQKTISDKMRDKERKAERKEGERTSPTESTKAGSARSTRQHIRKANSIEQQLPQSPRSYGRVVDIVLSRASPRKQSELEKRGVKRKLDESICSATASVRESLDGLRQGKMDKKARQHYKILSHAACRAIAKYPRMKAKVTTLLGIGGKVLRQKRVERKTRKDTLPQITKTIVSNYWKSESISREVPLKKRVKKGQPPFLLECSYTEAYRRFKSSHPQVKIGYVKFVQCRPKNVMHMQAMERIVCCCIKCENVKLKVQALNREVKKMKAPELQIKEIDDMAAKTVCPQPQNGRPDMKCLKRECTSCGLNAVRQYYRSVVETHEDVEGDAQSAGVVFDEWKMTSQEIRVKIKGGEGKLEKKTVKRLKRVTCIKDDITEVIDLLAEDMVTYPAHKYRANWQKSQFDKVKSNMPPQSAVVVVDFAMNYTCFLQDEVQSYHWSPPQVTIHPCYAYINTAKEASEPTHTEAIIIISPDPQHDAAAVAKYLQLCGEHLKTSYGITQMLQFSDCCASQYRCSTSFADISFSQDDLGLNVQRHYFESSHGKSPADGQGAVIKRAVTMAVTRREAQIRSAEELYAFCEEKLTDVGKGVFKSQQSEYQYAKRKFFYVKTEEINRVRPERAVKSVVGTMTVHCVKASGSQYKIQTRSLSCFCSHCLYGEGDGCTNTDTVGAWANVQLKPKTVVQRQRVASPEETDLDDPVDDSMYVVPGEMVASPEGTGLDDPADDSMSAVPREIVASPEDFVAVVLSDSRGRGKPVTYIAKVLQVDKGDVKLRFLKPSAAKDIYTWPQHNDISWQPQSDITMKLTPPQLVPGRGIKLRFSQADMTQLFTK